MSNSQPETSARSSKTSDEVAFRCGHTVAHEEDCPRCEVERLRRELGLKDALIDAMTDCIGPEDGQTFEERAEELIVTEVTHQNSRPAPETFPALPQRYRVQQDKGEYALKGCADGDLVDWSAYEALLRRFDRPALKADEGQL